jgi:hypothetical protein
MSRQGSASRCRLRKLCLRDVPVDARMAAARCAARELCDTAEEREEVLLAAMFPSTNVYRAPESAQPRFFKLQEAA